MSESVDQIIECNHWKESLTKSNFALVLFIVLCTVVLILQSVDEVLKCDHSNETFWALLSCGGLLCWARLVLTFESVDEILKFADFEQSYLVAEHAVYYSLTLTLTFSCLFLSIYWQFIHSSMYGEVTSGNHQDYSWGHLIRNLSRGLNVTFCVCK